MPIPAFTAAVVQAAPVAFDLDRTLAKVHTLTADAARSGARLVVFPEAFVSAYPRGLDFGAIVGARSDAGREDFRRYWESSIDVPGPACDSLAEAARTHTVYLVSADFGPAPAATTDNPRPRPAILPDTFTLLIYKK